MRVAALSLPPPDLSAETMAATAAASLRASLQLRPLAADTHWNAALLAGMAEGALGTWEQTPPLEGPPLMHSAAHGTLFEAADPSAGASARLAECLQHLRRPFAAARTVHGGVFADGGLELGGPSALWAFATTVGLAVPEAITPSDPEARQVLSMLLGTALPEDGSAESEAARIHAELVGSGALPTPSLGSNRFSVSWGVNASMERWRDVSRCATVDHRNLAADEGSPGRLRGVCQPAWSYVLRMGPTRRGYWWRARVVPTSFIDGGDYDVKWTADGGSGAASSAVSVVVTSDDRGDAFDIFVHSVDAAAHHARSLTSQLYPGTIVPDSECVTIVVQALGGAPLNQTRWRQELRATRLLELGLPDAAAERLSPTGFLRRIVSSLDQLVGAAPLPSTEKAAAAEPLVVWVGAEGSAATVPIDFFGSLEQHAVSGRQMYCPAGSSPDGSPLHAGAMVIGARLADMRRAVLRGGMEYWTADGAWVGSEAWALLRSFSHELQIARPHEPGLQFTAIPELGRLPSWWSAAGRSGLCSSKGVLHHPGLLSRSSLQGVAYHSTDGTPAPAAPEEQEWLGLVQGLVQESPGRCRLTPEGNRLVGLTVEQEVDSAAVTPGLQCASLPLGQDRPEECRAALRALMRTASDALSLRGVIHWLDFGTLLGALRERDIIAHTNDAEIASLFVRKADILAMRVGLLGCGVEMQNRAHSNDQNGVGVADYIELIDQRYVTNGTSEIKLDITLRTFISVNLLDGGDGVPTRARLLVDPTDNYANTVRSAVLPSQVLPLVRCEVHGVGFPCPKDGVELVKEYYGGDCMEAVKRDVHVAANGNEYVRALDNDELR